MTAAGYVHLHLHTEYSLLDGGNRVGRLVDRVKELGMDAVAITDHGNLFGAVAFYRACKDAEIKPILGIEAYVAPDVRTEVSDRRLKEAHGVADGGFHLVLLAENERGWSNLIRLSSDAYVEGFYYRPRMDKSTLEDWREGLIAINGHLGSSIAYHLDLYARTGADEHWERARAEAEWHAKVFAPNAQGEPCFYLELQRHDTPEQDAVNEHVVRLAEELSLPLVCDNDSHFLDASDWDAHDTLVCVSTGKSKDEPNRLHYPKELYVKSPEQMSALFGDIDEALANTRRIADRCNVELDFGANHAPLVQIERCDPPPLEAGESEPAEGTTDWFQRVCATFELKPLRETPGEERLRNLEDECDQALRDLAEAGLQWRYRGEVTPEHQARLDRELGVLSDKSISAYFLIVWDFVKEARSRGIPAMARGSGVGTMVGYLLGLSNACPVKYGLLFERFTDPDRSEYPDIDIDLCQDGRQEILDYVRDKYGYVAQIITFGTMKARAAIRDVGRVHDLPLQDVDKICKLIGDQLGVTIEGAMGREPELQALYDGNQQIREVVDTAKSLEGITRHSGVHAAGVVLATEPLENLVPLATSRSATQKDVLVTQWDGPTVEKMGLLKMDFLGLKTLSVVERARQLVIETLPDAEIRAAVGVTDPAVDPLDLDRIDLGDENVLDLYCRGETAGTFQFESDGMRNLLRKMKPDRLEDLVAANALFRPGPMALIDDYCDRKHGRQHVPKVHEIVDRHTADTHGIMVYQEQVMQIAHELGGIALREAYSLIKAISKKKHDVINSARERFLEGAVERDLAREKADELFDLILKFAGYGFNKSHSVGYSLLAYQTAFLKTYFPVQYMAAVLTYDGDNTEKLVHYISDAAKVRRPDGSRGIEVGPPDVNRSGVRFHVVYDKDEARNASTGQIRFGLSAVKGVGEKAVRAILEARDAEGPFESLFEFCERVSLKAVNRSTIEALIKSGAFDTVHGEDQRAAMIEALDGAIRSGQRAAQDRESGQGSLFGGPDPSNDDQEVPEAKLPSIPPWDTMQRLTHEKTCLGFYASSHPLDEHLDVLRRFSSARIRDLEYVAGETDVVIGAMLSSLRLTRTRKGRNPGQKMGLLTLEDKSGKIEAVVFADAFAELESELATDTIVFFKGKVDRRREEVGLVVSGIVPLEQAEQLLAKKLCVKLDCSRNAVPAGNGSQSVEEFRSELQEVLAWVDEERLKRRGITGDVEFEIDLGDRKVLTSANGVKVPIRPGITSELEAKLGRPRCCELRGERTPFRRIERAPT